MKNKKTSVQKLVSELDEMCRKAVKKKAKYRCERCGALGVQAGGIKILHWAHVAGRTKRETRWGFVMKDGTYCWNAFSLCAHDHLWFDDPNNRTDTDYWLESKLGRAKWLELRERARQTHSWGVYELTKKLEEVKEYAE